MRSRRLPYRRDTAEGVISGCVCLCRASFGAHAATASKRGDAQCGSAETPDRDLSRPLEQAPGQRPRRSRGHRRGPARNGDASGTVDLMLTFIEVGTEQAAAWATATSLLRCPADPAAVSLPCPHCRSSPVAPVGWPEISSFYAPSRMSPEASLRTPERRARTPRTSHAPFHCRFASLLQKNSHGLMSVARLRALAIAQNSGRQSPQVRARDPRPHSCLRHVLSS